MVKKKYILPEIRVVQIGGEGKYCDGGPEIFGPSQTLNTDDPWLVREEDGEFRDNTSDGLSSSGSYNIWEKGW